MSSACRKSVGNGGLNRGTAGTDPYRPCSSRANTRRLAQPCLWLSKCRGNVYSPDGERAAMQVVLLCKLDVPVVAVVAGMAIAPETHREATGGGVWQMIDDTAVLPAAA